MKTVTKLPTRNGLTLYGHCHAIRSSSGKVVDFDTPREFVIREVPEESEASALFEISIDLPEIDDVPTR